MRVLLVCDSSLDKESLQQLLQEHGNTLVATIRPSDNLLVIGSASKPGAIIVFVKKHDRQLFEQLEKLEQIHACPVIVFSQKSSEEFARESVKAGISAYIVDGFSPDRLKPIVEIAVARFKKTRELQDRLMRTREALSDRKLIDKAKVYLIEQKGMTEDQAYQMLRRTAANQNMRIGDLAKNIVSVVEVLNK
jgi:two-component system, response regulator / RNA-binding antiterminator